MCNRCIQSLHTYTRNRIKGTLQRLYHSFTCDYHRLEVDVLALDCEMTLKRKKKNPEGLKLSYKTTHRQMLNKYACISEEKIKECIITHNASLLYSPSAQDNTRIALL